MGTWYDDLCKFMIISRWILLTLRNVSDKRCRESQNTFYVLLLFFFRNSCQLWDNVEKHGRPTARQATHDMIIRRMHFVCWITKATDTRRICSTYRFWTTTTARRTHVSVTLKRTLPALCDTRLIPTVSKYWLPALNLIIVSVSLCLGKSVS